MLRRVSLLTLLLCPTLVTGQALPTPEALARSLQQRYQGVQDFSADFTHVYRGGVLRTQSREHGTVKIKKPGRMRWQYTGPERKNSFRMARSSTRTYRKTNR